jgi:hypothetical protein
MSRDRDRRAILVAVGALVIAVAVAASRVVGGGVGAAPTCADPVAWNDAGDRAGEQAAVVGPVAAVTYVPDVGGSPTFVNLGNPHPETDRFDIVIYRDLRDQLEEPPDESLVGQTVCAIGEVRLRDGVPQIILRHPAGLQRPER